jgi:ComF family protein
LATSSWAAPNSSLPRRLLSATWDALLDFVYPPRCGGCDARGTFFCDNCARSIVPVSDDRRIAGLDGIVSVGVFAGPLRTAIHNLKYESETALAKPLALLLWSALSADSKAGEQPVLVPVPLHLRRERTRGYNQSALLSKELSSLTGWRVEKNLLRVRETAAQVGLGAKERQDNVRGAFSWSGGGAPENVMLVDDVCTTGSTLSECASALRSAGTGKVYAATVARAAGDAPSADV